MLGVPQLNIVNLLLLPLFRIRRSRMSSNVDIIVSETNAKAKKTHPDRYFFNTASAAVVNILDML
jgi:hypothetical protein